MNTRRIICFCVVAGAAGLLEPTALAGQVVGSGTRPSTAHQDPLPQGQRIEAHDGDIIAIEDDARVRIIRHRRATVRTIFSAAQRWLVVLADFPVTVGTVPDGRVDTAYGFTRVEGAWPLGERWEGEVVIEDYSMSGQGGSQGLGLVTAKGLVQLFGPIPDSTGFKDSRAIGVLTYRGSHRNLGGEQSFDEAEPRVVADAVRNAESDGQTTTIRSVLPGGIAVNNSVTATSGVVGIRPVDRGDAPVRVGGNIVKPRKVHDVRPVLPDAARDGRVIGTVILELTIGADGSVTDAKILRSIPLLDAAALAAARQWRYEPTFLNGKAVPVILTEVVTFE